MPYTTSNAVAGIGALLQVDNGASPDNYNTITESTDITWNGLKLDFFETTNYQSVGGYKERKPGLFDPGDMTVKMNYLPVDTIQQQVQSDFNAKTLRNFKLLLPNDPLTSPLASLGTWTFAGYFAETPFNLPLDKAMEMTLKIQITGKPVFTPGT